MKKRIASFGALSSAALVIVALGAGPLYAQDDRPEAMDMRGDCPMGCPHGAGLGPELALAHRDALALSPEQAAALQVVAGNLSEQRARVSRQMRAVHDRIEAATQGERFDETTLRPTLELMSELHAEAALEKLRAQHATLEVLTSSQEAQLRQLAAQAPMSGMHGGSMMGECPMMNHQDGAAAPR